ncbi:MAG: hypothetical protein HZB36_04425 [Candidatus Omnitrophica bacterium]|nr:hypothetical protein [Candidatus Omnitrophota bacterium]
MKQFTISIVNWNVCGYLEKCLESIYKYSQGIDLEVIVVDNASVDEIKRTSVTALRITRQ